MTDVVGETIEKNTIDLNESLEFCLCDAKLEYVQIHAYAKISKSYFEVNAINYVQCDHSFGGGFTSYHHYVFDSINTLRFYQLFQDPADLVFISKHMKQQFGSPDGLMKLEKYCNEKSIKYHYTYRSEE